MILHEERLFWERWWYWAWRRLSAVMSMHSTSYLGHDDNQHTDSGYCLDRRLSPYNGREE